MTAIDWLHLHFLVSFQKYCSRWFLSKFSFRIFDRISQIDRSSASFRFLILIYFMDYSSDTDANLTCFCRRLPTRFLSLPAERRLRDSAAATKQRSLGCECESAVVPAALPPPLHASGSSAIGHSAEPAARLGQPKAWSRLNGWRVAHNSKCISRCKNPIPAN